MLNDNIDKKITYINFRKVLSVPKIKNGLHDMRCCDGDAVTLKCRFFTSSNPPTIYWEKAGKVNYLVIFS